MLVGLVGRKMRKRERIIIVKNILASIKTISRKAKIDYKQFCEDIFQYCKLINLPIESNLKV